jgi:hypothetical protein
MIKPGLRKSSGASAASLVVFTGPGQLLNVQCLNGAGATNTVQVFDATSLPANGTVPDMSPGSPVSVSTSQISDFGAHGTSFNLGCVVAKSTTVGTLTIGAADGIISATYTR